MKSSTPIDVRMSLEQATALWLSRYSSENTRAAYGSDLRTFVEWLDDGSVFTATAQLLELYRLERESSGVRSSTVDRQFAALRSFYEVACELGSCAANPFAPRPPAAPTASDTAMLDADEVQRLFDASQFDPRAAVLVQLLLAEGMRLSEVLALDVPDVGGTTRERCLRVRRHGREVVLTLTPSSTRAITRLQRRSDGEGPLLTVRNRQGRRPTRLSRFGADLLIKRAASSAGIDQRVSANVLRRTHVARAHLAGVHIDDISRRMGHRDVRTTRRYLTPEQHQPETTT